MSQEAIAQLLRYIAKSVDATTLQLLTIREAIPPVCLVELNKAIELLERASVSICRTGDVIE